MDFVYRVGLAVSTLIRLTKIIEPNLDDKGTVTSMLTILTMIHKIEACDG